MKWHLCKQLPLLTHRLAKVHAELSQSKGQARKAIEDGGVKINNVREANAARAVTTSNLLFGKHILLRKGKKNYVVVKAKG